MRIVDCWGGYDINDCVTDLSYDEISVWREYHAATTMIMKRHPRINHDMIERTMNLERYL